MKKTLLFLDFECAYNTKKGASKYDVKSLGIVRYVRDPRYLSFGVGITFGDNAPSWISAKDIPAWIMRVAMTTGWENIALVSHNVKFDGSILKHVYGVTPGQYIDTKGMSKAVLGKMIKNHTLQTISEHYKLEGKGEMRTDGKRTLTAAEEAELATYCLHDVELCRAIYKEFAKEFPEGQYEALHRTIDMFVNPRLRLNIDLLKKTNIQEAERRANIFTEIGIEKAQFSSNDKFSALLVSKGYEVPLKNSPRKKDANGDPVKIPAFALGDAQFLDMLESENDELRLLCEARVAAKSTLLETRSKKLMDVGITGAWPFDVEFSGADQTHRFSGGPGAGGNPQNFSDPKKVRDPRRAELAAALRDSVEAPEGYRLVVGDFSSVEFRIVTFLSKDPGLLQSVKENSDIYCDFASAFYGRKITKDKKDKRERDFGKQAILGLGYGMGADKFIATVRKATGQKITKEEAKKAVDLYRTRYAGVKALWEKLDSLIAYLTAADPSKVQHGLPIRLGHECIYLPSGLKIRYPNLRQEVQEKGPRKGQSQWVFDVWNKGHIERRSLYGGKLLENISQGLAGELTKEAMDRMGDCITGQVHDELHALTKRGLEMVVKQKLKRAMSISPKWMPEMILEAEVGCGTTWLRSK